MRAVNFLAAVLLAAAAIAPNRSNTETAVKPPIPASQAWQRFDSAALGMRIPGYRSKAGVTAEVPASWTKSDMPEPNVIEFDGPQATGDDKLYVLFRAERRSLGTTLASEAKALKAKLANSADNYRLQDERIA